MICISLIAHSHCYTLPLLDVLGATKLQTFLCVLQQTVRLHCILGPTPTSARASAFAIRAASKQVADVTAVRFSILSIFFTMQEYARVCTRHSSFVDDGF